MAEPNKTALKPYRIGLEALISHLPPVKISEKLGFAAAHIDDPDLRELFKTYIGGLHNFVVCKKKDPINIHQLRTFQDSDKVVSYLEGVIDGTINYKYFYHNPDMDPSKIDIPELGSIVL